MYKHYRAEFVAITEFYCARARAKKAFLAGRKSVKHTSGGSGAWIDMLAQVSDMELWGGVRRQERDEWKCYLDEAAEFVRQPRKPLQQDVVLNVIRGDVGGDDVTEMLSLRSKVIVFVSSTFTDTMAERNTLMKDVYPYLRSLCRILGLDFAPVDMRWGVKEEVTDQHGTLDVCLREVVRCTRESAGPAFLCLLGDKYGYRPLPPVIDQSEFEKLLSALGDLSDDTTTLTSYYRLDTNAVPPVYVLKPVEKGQKDWWDTSNSMQAQLRRVAGEALPAEQAKKYFVSVTETEVEHGLLRNENVSRQVVVVERHLEGVETEKHINRKLIDVSGGQKEVDTEAQRYLSDLKKVKVIDVVSDEAVIRVDYARDDLDQCSEYVRRVCDRVCERLARSILDTYRASLHVEDDPGLREVLQHRTTLVDKCRGFVGRFDLLTRVADYVNDYATATKTARRPLVLHGQSGCGKTALVAMATRASRDAHTDAVVVVRFLGTTSSSGSARAMLRSVCEQISRAYKRDTTNIPTSYKDLVPFFHTCLSYASLAQPLLVFLDSLDQLSNDDFGRNLKWLRPGDQLPANVRLVVSTLPGECLRVLEAFLPSACLVEVHPLSQHDGPAALDSMLAEHARTLTSTQRDIVLEAFRRCPLPLYLRLAVDVARRWASYDVISMTSLPGDMRGLVTTLFERLERHYGTVLVRHALGYITAAKNGLSVTELEDILSCDDDVLEEVFTYWLPPLRRIPPLLWIRIRNDLGPYLVERGTDGVSAYGWYHRQFWEAAEQRFLDQSPGGADDVAGHFRQRACAAIADYFDGRWSDGKVYTPSKEFRYSDDMRPRMEDRQTPTQPLLLAGDRRSGNRKLNRRKLSEMPQSLIGARDWRRFERVIGSLEFIERKFEADQGYECIGEFIAAARQSGSYVIKAFSKFIGANISHLVREPAGIYQLASQQVQDSTVRKLFDACAKDELPAQIITDLYPVNIEDPCEMTLQGHTTGVRCCRYSPTGNLIASTAEDASLRLWDAYTGAEVVTVSGLPGPTYPALADPYHGERPCCFSGSGRMIATGSEDGWIQVWDVNGAQVYGQQDHDAGITGLTFSPADDCELASCSKDGTVKFWDVTSDFRLIASVRIGGEATCCDYSPDGAVLAVSIFATKGLTFVAAKSDHRVLKSVGSLSALCCGYSPTGQHVATGGSNSTVTIYEAPSGERAFNLTGHMGWVWCVQFTSDGAHLLSCSSDRSLKMWDVDRRTCLISLGGHLHRVSSVSICPAAGQTFVTSSLDCSLKVWNMAAVASGRVPPRGGLHYTIVEVSPCGNYLATSQGWSCNCRVEHAQTRQVIGMSSGHGGCINQAAFTGHGDTFVSLDHGHSGQYDTEAVYRAQVKVSSLERGIEMTLVVRGPSTIGCNPRYIVVGTAYGTVHAFTAQDFTEVCKWMWNDGGSTVTSEDDTSIGHVACSPTGDHVAALYDHVCKAWVIGSSDSGTRATFVSEMRHQGDGDAKLRICLYSPDGRHLVTASYSGLMHVWNAQGTYSLHHVITGNVSMIRDMAFSPTGSYLATVAVEMTLRVWAVGDGYSPRAVYYSPVNKLGFLAEHELVVGEATGNRHYLQLSQ